MSYNISILKKKYICKNTSIIAIIIITIIIITIFIILNKQNV
jgi:hypothetical protein